MKPGEGRVRHAATAVEAIDDLVLDEAHHRHVLREVSKALRLSAAAEDFRCRGDQAEDATSIIATRDAPASHRAEPLTHVAFVQLRLRRDLRTRRGPGLAHRGEKPGAMADRDHHG